MSFTDTFGYNRGERLQNEASDRRGDRFRGRRMCAFINVEVQPSAVPPTTDGSSTKCGFMVLFYGRQEKNKKSLTQKNKNLQNY